MWIIIVAAILLVIIVLLFSPVRINMKYHDQMTVFIEYLLFKIQIFPEKPSKKAKDTENDKEEKKLKIVSIEKFLRFMYRVIKFASGILKDIGKKCTINLLDVNIAVGCEDAAQTAIRYGEVCAVVGSVIGIIEGNTPVKKHQINISPDFANAKFSLDLDIIISARLNTLLGILIKHGSTLFETSKGLNIVKGGTAK